MATVGYGTVPFAEQIEFFRRKRNVLTESWLDLWESEHDTALMVAGANRDDLVADFARAIEKAVADGTTLEEFRRDFDRIVSTYGWDYKGGRNWRSRVIYETNLRQSYNAGRWKQLQDLKKVRPWWRYRHSDAVEHPRPEHEAWDGMILHCDDPWWLFYFPANGWGCQCYVEALSDRDLKRLGKSGPDKAPAINMQAVLVGKRSPGGPVEVETPQGIDPGFAYAPGRSLGGWPTTRGGPQTPPALRDGLERALQTALRKSTRLPADTAARSASQAMAPARAADALQAGFTEWRAAAAAGRGNMGQYLVGAIDQGVVRKLAAEAVKPQTAAILIDSPAVLQHLPAAVATNLPAALRNPLAVLLDKAAGVLRYVLSGDGSRRVVVDVGLQQAQAANGISTAALVPLADLRSAISAGRLQVLDGAVI